MCPSKWSGLSRIGLVVVCLSAMAPTAQAHALCDQDSSGTKNQGGQGSDGAKNPGGQASSGARDLGGMISSGAKNLGGQVSSGAKNLGGQVSSGAKNLGGQISSGAKNSVPKIPTPKIPTASIHDVRREGKRFRELIQREWVNGRKEVGKPWNRGIRDPWVNQLERWYNTGQARLDEAQREFDNQRSRFPLLLSGVDLNCRNTPGGSIEPRPFGDILVNAPHGGTVGYPVIYYYYEWGWSLRFATRFKILSGSARLVVRRNDGTVVASSVWRSAPFSAQEEFDATLPPVAAGNSFKTEDGFGGKYLAAVELSPNSRVDLWYLAYWRPDVAFYDPDKVLFSRLGNLRGQ